ncbi:MAG: biopolymer transporter ExbD [Deltaproteobacteria bacterium]|nr:biopolymer transporter ExbD [Deltaproteobacteria bacterium]
MPGPIKETQDGEDEIISEINIIPLVDIVLVLLIIFMVTATLITGKAIKVELPKASTGEDQEASTLWITMNAGERLFLNGKPTDRHSLALAIRKERTKHPDVQAILTIDSKVRHGEVIGLIDLIRLAGVGRFSFNVMPKSGEPQAP